LSGAAGHRFTYNRTQRQSVTASTALTTKSHGTSSNGRDLMRGTERNWHTPENNLPSAYF
jgi:hypothetical protein